MKNFPSVLECINDLLRDQVNDLIKLAFRFKEYPDEGDLQSLGKFYVAPLFLENSTRTLNSFHLATAKLNGNFIYFEAHRSSLAKGESNRETFRTLAAQGVDILITRSTTDHFLQEFKSDPPLKIINGGDGTHQHPTQALLDLMTIFELCNHKYADITVAIVGDLLHSRVCNSLLDLFKIFNIKTHLTGPLELRNIDISKYPNVTMFDNIDDAISNVDFVYLLRMQKERFQKSKTEFSEKDYNLKWGLNLDRVNKLTKKPMILHPGPVNIGVELSQDLINGPLYKGHQQVVNSIYMRMAIIQSLIQNNDKKVGQFL